VGDPAISDDIVGRERERAALAASADAAEQRRAQVVWLEGEAGTGKTSLARNAVRQLGDRFVVLWTAADEPSRDVAYATIAQLGVNSAANPFTAGLALVERLAMLQSDSPVAIVVEDLQWCDAASRAALLTAARRLEDDAPAP
jgi:predicted ATPase